MPAYISKTINTLTPKGVVHHRILSRAPKPSSLESPKASPNRAGINRKRLREDFSAETKRNLANRVNGICSNPDCRAQTSGPNSDPSKALNIGVAAHITAASPGGPRYDPKLTPEERIHPSNGIWLCQNCGKRVDSDVSEYTVATLLAWKERAESTARESLGRTAIPESNNPIPKFTIHTLAPTTVVQHSTVSLDVNVFRSGAFTLPAYILGAVIPFENRVANSGDGDVAEVWAEVIIRSASLGMEMSRLPSACWIDHPRAEIDFPLNTPRYLLIGGWEIVDKTYTSDIKLFEFDRLLNRPVERRQSFEGYPHDLILDITLTANGYHEAAQRFQYSFCLLNRGLYSIRPLAGAVA